MNLHTLPRIVEKSKKRIGRGIGSGKGGHTVGRGQKGQKSRGDKIGVAFFGTKMKKSLLKRLPMLRGKGKFKGHVKPVTIPTSSLASLPKGSEVTLDALLQSKIIKKRDWERGVKIVGSGSLDKALTVALPTTKGARHAIIKAGGRVE